MQKRTEKKNQQQTKQTPPPKKKQKQKKQTNKKTYIHICFDNKSLLYKLFQPDIVVKCFRNPIWKPVIKLDDSR